MGAKSSRQYTYQQYYEAMKKSGQAANIDLKNINMETIDPYEVFNISKNFTWNELKETYRKLAISTHPDKPGGNKDIFNIITYCFEKLALEYKKRESDLSHMELKKQSSDFFDKIVNNKMPHPSIVNMNGREGDNAELFSQKFNRNFEKCKVYDDEMEFGYGKNMDESSKVREDIKIDKVIKKNKIDNKSFNDIFNSKVPINKQLVKYQEPEPLLLAKSLQFTELGNKRPDDYSSSSVKKTNSLSYSDYMKAHEGTRLIDTSIIKDMKEFKSVEEYEVYRDTKAKVELSAKELKQQELKKLREEKEEQMRLERLNKYDRNIELSYEKANRLFIR
uniref:J domain-containing protein n=1 Tax=viral metagenome TaxID=1070528 RepID=A0A6C0LEP9_9ZZZZ